MARWHLPAILLLSAAYQSLFIWNGLSPLDEGWPLYAAMRLQAGGTLYRDVYWVFPPGALLPAWVGYALHLLGQRLITPAEASRRGLASSRSVSSR